MVEKRRRVRVAVIVGAVLTGIGMLLGSWPLRSSPPDQAGAWVQDLLVNVGAAVLLVVPIELISAALSARVEEVSGEVEEARRETSETRDDVVRVRTETAQSVDEIRRDVQGVRDRVATLQEFGDQIAARLAANRAEEEALYRRVGLDGNAPDRETIVEALRRAHASGVVSASHGPRAEPHPGTGDYLRLAFEPNDFGEPEVGFYLGGTGTAGVRGVPWNEDQSATDVLLEVARVLRTEGIEGSFDVAAWFRQISETLVVGASHAERHGIIELCPPQWAVTETGVVPYPNNALRGAEPASVRDPTSVAAMKAWPWVDDDSLDRAVHVWKSIFGARDPWDPPLPGEPPF